MTVSPHHTSREIQLLTIMTGARGVRPCGFKIFLTICLTAARQGKSRLPVYPPGYLPAGQR
ncbi:MAG: hypothetical protein ACYC11_10155, partial [Bellilinea sp.]